MVLFRRLPYFSYTLVINMFYSASINAFLASAAKSDYVRKGLWPSDVIKATDNEWQIYGQSEPPEGMQRGADENDRPTWVPIPAASLENLASQKRREIDSAAARVVAGIRSLYPDFERETWSDQEDEARAWTENNKAPTPTLTGIAEARGVTVAYLVPKVIQKADQYRALAASVAGKRQGLEDDIAAALAAEDREALEAIEWE
jgi:hypothetical protein